MLQCMTMSRASRDSLLARAQQLVLCSTCITHQTFPKHHELGYETTATEQPLCSSPDTRAAASGPCLADFRPQEGSVSPRDTQTASMDRQSCSY